jgi:hypothetical protein
MNDSVTQPDINSNIVEEVEEVEVRRNKWSIFKKIAKKIKNKIKNFFKK